MYSRREALRAGQVVVELHGAKLPLAADAVGHDEIGLRPVERRLAALDVQVGQVHLAAHLLQRRLGPLPVLGAADVLVAGRIAEPQPHAVIVQPQRLQHELRHLDAAAELVGHLLLGAEDVGVVLREAAHPRHAVQLARLLETMHRAELGQPQRQVAVAPRLRLVDRDVVRAVHRPQQIALAFGHFDRRKLRVLVIRIMARGLVQMHVADHRRVDRLIAAADQLGVEEVLQFVPHRRPPWAARRPGPGRRPGR